MRDFSGGPGVKNLSAKAGDVRDAALIPDQEAPLEKETATPSSLLAWRIPRTEKPGGLQSIGSQRVRHDGLKLARRQPGSLP